MVRARVRWAEEGEKPTKYFCNLESRNHINKTIFKVTKDNGDTINKQEEILKEVKNFYSNLYKTQDIIEDKDIQEIFKDLQTSPKLSLEERNKL